MDEWPRADKHLAHDLTERASENSGAELLRWFRETEVDDVEDLWKLEEKIREWRKERAFEFNMRYSRIESDLAIWIRRGWLTLEDVRGFSTERFERIRRIVEM